MADPPADHDARIQAEQLLNRLLSEGRTNELLDAITADLQQASKQANVRAAVAVAAESRLAKIEKQTQVLAEAILAITHTDRAAAAPALQAMIHQMTDQPKS